MKKRLITSALPYVNNVPHMGHIVGCHLPADIFNRYSKLKGYDTLFIGGSDCHGTPAMLTAKEKGKSVEEVVSSLHEVHKAIYKKLNISYDIYSRTNSEKHYEIASEFFTDLYNKGFLEENSQRMFYCIECKMYLPDTFVIGTCPRCGFEGANGDQCEKCTAVYALEDLVNPTCKVCGHKPTICETKHMFFKLNEVQDKLDKWLDSKKDVFAPHVYAEAKRWIKEGLRPRAITRDVSWGIPVPLKGYEDKVLYVWFEAPIGYISFTEQAKEGGIKEFWQNEDAEIFNFLGKDNIPFHTVFFPAMLLANEKYNLAQKVIGLNYLNYEGQKFSKSKKIGVFCNQLLEENDIIDIDALRGYLTTVIPEQKDTDFKWEDYKNVVNSDLVGKLGNLFNRTLNMANKNFGGTLTCDLSKVALTPEDEEILNAIKTYPAEIADLFENHQFRQAFRRIMDFASVGNTYLEKTAPWSAIKQENGAEVVNKILYLCVSLCASLTIVASPILPISMQKMAHEQLLLNIDFTQKGLWDKASTILLPTTHKVGAPMPLYTRVDDERLNALKEFLSVPFEI